jgi:hypothetical protein
VFGLAPVCFAEDAEVAGEDVSILPVLDYSGDLWSRSTLTGDWWGARNDLSARGISFSGDLTWVLQSVVDGGYDAPLLERLMNRNRADDTEVMGAWN